MARTSKRLNARSTVTLSERGMHADGDGLYLVIGRNGSKRWSYIFQWQGKRKEMGLGGLASVGLADAREIASEQRRILAKGQNPIEARKAARAAQKNTEHTFGSFADQLIDDLASQFRNTKHIEQWRMTMRIYAAPIRKKHLDDINTEDVLSVLRPIWQTKAETASRVRGRIERVLDAAKAKELRSGENPARWRGHLDKLLPKRQKLSRGHHAAMPYDEVPALINKLRDLDTISALALEWTILTASRSGEALGAKWSEIDQTNRIWIIPPERMKAGRAHRIPLTDRLITILEQLEKSRVDNPYLFPGTKPSKSLSNMALAMQLRRLKIDGVTVHGFRSSFRDWAAEETHFARETAEAALAHVIGDATERAYRRGDALEKRRQLMQAWERHCSDDASNVVELHTTGVSHA